MGVITALAIWFAYNKDKQTREIMREHNLMLKEKDQQTYAFTKELIEGHRTLTADLSALLDRQNNNEVCDEPPTALESRGYPDKARPQLPSLKDQKP